MTIQEHDDEGLMIGKMLQSFGYKSAAVVAFKTDGTPMCLTLGCSATFGIPDDTTVRVDMKADKWNVKALNKLLDMQLVKQIQGMEKPA